MVYVGKTCPICGQEFSVLKKAEKKAIYCTLACLIADRNKLESKGVIPAGSS